MNAERPQRNAPAAMKPQQVNIRVIGVNRDGSRDRHPLLAAQSARGLRPGSSLLACKGPTPAREKRSIDSGRDPQQRGQVDRS
jgi:hypothetical protein